MKHMIESIKFVVDNAQHININEDKIFEFSKNYTPQETIIKNNFPFDTKTLDLEQEIAFLFLTHSVGFSTWGDEKWSVEYQGKTISRGTYALAAAMYRAFDENYDIFNPEYLKNISFKDVSHIFRGSEVEIPMIKERHKILIELGTIISTKFDSSFTKFIESTNYDAKVCVEMLVSNFSYFKDESTYLGEKVYFYKFAQLLTQQLIELLPDKIFTNTTIFSALADYKIPYILYSFEILEYSPDLTEKLSKKVELKHNSVEEIEIRAAMVMAVNLIYFMLKNKYPEITLSEVNNYLWLNSSQVSKDALPHHRTRSVYY